MPHRPLLLVLPVLLLLLTMPSAAAASPPVADIAAQVDEEAAHSGLPGFAVTVTRGTSLLYAGGRGVDHAGAPMTATTPLSLASLSKSFTAVAAVRLAARGQIALDRPVTAQLSEFRTADPRGALITPRHLLTQTSGLTDATAHAEAIDNAWDPAGAVARLHSATLATGPGARFAYTNANYEVIARLLEVAGGAPFPEILRREVFAPLGMVDTHVGVRTDAQPGAVSVLGVWAPALGLPRCCPREAPRGSCPPLATWAAGLLFRTVTVLRCCPRPTSTRLMSPATLDGPTPWAGSSTMPPPIIRCSGTPAAC